MNRCPACSAAVAENILACPSCGASLAGTQPTVRQPPPKVNGAPRKSSHSISANSRGEGHFIAGTILDERYRVLGLLGRGGMGEVYKAEDLKLNQTVALKFLPANFSKDNAALESFFGEVRTARQVSHPNVCRVFDIGEVEGSHFLSMEFIDGDDLSSLLRRIGRLPPDKAVEIARQLCAGLHAIHQAGVLHRDLKPANAIIDGRGKARITDFGIAGLESELKGGGGVAGTPAYMSPEQITGKELTAKSDIYSLGLVLYEIFTGRQVFDGATLNELIRKHKTSAPTAPSELVKDIDPLVGRDFLVGILFGLCFTLLPKLYFLYASRPAADVGLDVLLGARFAVGDFLHSMGGAIFDPLGYTFVFTLLRVLVRRNWLAVAFVLSLSVLPGILSGSPPAVVLGLTFGGLLVLAFTRFGLLTLTSATMIFFWLNSLPFTTNLSAWYAGTSLFVMFIVTALAGYAFYTSLGGQRVFKENLSED